MVQLLEQFGLNQILTKEVTSDFILTNDHFPCIAGQFQHSCNQPPWIQSLPFLHLLEIPVLQ